MSVPIPSLEKTSASSPSSTVPSMMWTRGTPPRSALTALVSFDRLEPASSALFFLRTTSASSTSAGDQPIVGQFAVPQLDAGIVVR